MNKRLITTILTVATTCSMVGCSNTPKYNTGDKELDSALSELYTETQRENKQLEKDLKATEKQTVDKSNSLSKSASDPLMINNIKLNLLSATITDKNHIFIEIKPDSSIINSIKEDEKITGELIGINNNEEKIEYNENDYTRIKRDLVSNNTSILNMYLINTDEIDTLTFPISWDGYDSYKLKLKYYKNDTIVDTAEINIDSSTIQHMGFEEYRDMNYQNILDSLEYLPETLTISNDKAALSISNLKFVITGDEFSSERGTTDLYPLEDVHLSVKNNFNFPITYSDGFGDISLVNCYGEYLNIHAENEKFPNQINPNEEFSTTRNVLKASTLDCMFNTDNDILVLVQLGNTRQYYKTKVQKYNKQ